MKRRRRLSIGVWFAIFEKKNFSPVYQQWMEMAKIIEAETNQKIALTGYKWWVWVKLATKTVILRGKNKS